MARAISAVAVLAVLLASLPASAQFMTLEANPTSEEAWAAAFETRAHFDGAAHEEYAHRAYLLFLQQPGLLHARFLAGDARAVVLLQDIFIEGTWVLHDAEGDDAAETERVLSGLTSFVSALEALRPPRHDYDSVALHDALLARARELLSEWPEKRKALVSRR